MSQMPNTTIRRTGGNLDVFTGILFVATLVLAAGIFMLATKNMDHSKAKSTDDGGMFKLVQKGR